MGLQPDGTFVAKNATLRILIRDAYQVQDFQILNEPEWSAVDYFDVTARAKPGALQQGPSALPPAQQILRALLSDRFQLRVRIETRQMPAFELRMRRDDKKTGPGLRLSTAACADRARMPSSPPTERPQCGIRTSPGNITAGAISPPQLAVALSQITGRPVIDRTGLSGRYDVDLSWTPEPFKRGTGQPAPPVAPGIDPNGPSLYSSIGDQLGLKMDFGSSAVRVIFIERAQAMAQ